MTAYNFKARFAGPIRRRVKRQTVRAIGRRRHVRPGELLQLYQGMRTKQCELISAEVCERISPIEIHFRGRRAWIAIHFQDMPRRKLDRPDDLNAFAKSDGFVDWGDLRHFWRVNHPGVVDFEGVLIEW